MDISDASPVSAHPTPSVRVGRRTLVVLAGVPGAGKSTVLAKLRASSDVVRLDSEQVRARLRELSPGVAYRYYRPLVHLAHRSRIAWSCLVARGPVVAHEPATRASTRMLLLVFARLTGRRTVLVWLHADAGSALDGQRARGRLIRSGSFRRHVLRAERMHRRLLAGETLPGWRRVHLFTREQVAGGLRLDVET
ncbi:AAA family ATPase [Saccharopolyspora sp. ID03-671]|uniref:AAA family ATPase n=1 Tax=Saccharopolyspora sp. ID03-671 TaxID=3073066 RepID=UPI0032464468